MKNHLDGGEAILEGFRNLGIDYIMSSPGSEWGSVWEALARQKVEAIPGPAYLSCWHETLAVDMAIGYTMATGRMQAVMLHAGVGLLQGSVGIHAAYIQNIPMVILSGEALTLSYHHAYGLPTSVVRPFNTYGPRQSARAIIPTIISQILAGKTDIKLGSLRPTRDLTFVKDTVEGFLEIHRSNDARGEVVNIGNNEEISIGELAKLIGDLMNVSLRISSDEKRIRPALSEVERLKCDNSKILKMSAWKPKFTLEAGLLNTIQWLTSHLHLYEPEKYSV